MLDSDVLSELILVKQPNPTALDLSSVTQSLLLLLIILRPGVSKVVEIGQQRPDARGHQQRKDSSHHSCGAGSAATRDEDTTDHGATHQQGEDVCEQGEQVAHDTL